ncbi:hypothetical protein WG219_09940 [Ectopseudomonas mendocina]|uniref:Uncharacterized protein n=1 Tax=Ectopseudomonas mendocina TaxID=300 RepID=A0ABZ2RSR1_ECTME
MFSSQVCDAALMQLSAGEIQALEQEAVRRGCTPREAMLAVALESLQQQLYALAQSGRRLELVRG